MTAYHIADKVNECHRQHAAAERESLNRNNWQRQKYRERRAECRTTRYAQNIGRDQWIAKQALVRRARRGQCGADHHGSGNAGAANLKNDGVVCGGQCVCAAG